LRNDLMTNVIEFNHVSKKFVLPHEYHRARRESWFDRLRHHREWRETFWALHDVSFAVRGGETVGLIGPNGSGKSTILKLIARILLPTSGNIATHGRVASLLELGAGFHHELSGRDNVYLNASVLGMDHKETDRIFDDVVAFAELERFIDAPVKFYSSGMYVRLAFAIAIHVQPDILLIDETLSVGDQSFQAKCMTRIHEIKAQGATILLVSHDLSTVQALCERGVWLEHGQIQAAGPTTDVVMAYLHHVAQNDEATARTVTPIAQHGQRWGSGQIRITRVELCDGQGHPRSTFVTSGVMDIRLHYEIDGVVDDPIFELAVHHQNGTQIAGPSTGFGGLRFPSVLGAGSIVYHIQSLPLLEGEYLLSVCARNRPETETYDYHDRAYLFRVSMGKSRERHGLVTLDGTWQVVPARELIRAALPHDELVAAK
ncbi:MAG: ABC transporter ATP-binding protein, partial [Chloroflexota bacterium]